MEKYKYELEKYRGRSTRHECPACKTKDSFARYVDEQGHYISDIVGRCNREDKCGYHLTPAEFFKDKGINYTPTIHVTPKPMRPTDYIPEEIVLRSLSYGNNLMFFLSGFFEQKKIKDAVEKYRIGGTKDGRVIYWQIDEQGRVRTGKIMAYNPDTGKRVKNVPHAFDWAHRHVKSDYQLGQCLYGLHLIYIGAKIGIVESEKTAIVASMAIPDYVWLATGGKQNYRLLEAVKGRDVTLFPDLGAYEQWEHQATKYGFQISGVLESVATPEDRAEGLDIADFILREIK